MERASVLTLIRRKAEIAALEEDHVVLECQDLQEHAIWQSVERPKLRQPRTLRQVLRPRVPATGARNLKSAQSG